jgi:hypothetical protein
VVPPPRANVFFGFGGVKSIFRGCLMRSRSRRAVISTSASGVAFLFVTVTTPELLTPSQTIAIDGSWARYAAKSLLRSLISFCSVVSDAGAPPPFVNQQIGHAQGVGGRGRTGVIGEQLDLGAGSSALQGRRDADEHLVGLRIIKIFGERRVGFRSRFTS